MPLASGVTIMWPSTNASIPAGWTRATTMDSTYPKGTAAAVNPNVTGGSATHTHTAAGHTHTVGSHSHGAGTSGSANLVYVGTTYGGGSNDHTHTTGTTGTNTGTSTSTVGAWGSVSGEPAYYGVIWITSDGTPGGFPSLSWVFWDKVAALPTSWSNPAAARNVFARGAVAAADAGTTGGGAHQHTGTTHTHAFNNHTHTGGTSGSTSTGAASNQANSGAQRVDPVSAVHTHTWSADSGSTQGNTAASGDTGSSSYEPAWAKLAIVQNDSGAANAQVRHVAVWLGTLANIPTDWALCDGTNSTVDMRDKFVKGANGVSEIGNTGGAAGHSHTDPATHTHAYDHTNPVTLASTNLADIGPIANGGAATLNPDHGHPSGGATASAAGTSGTGTQTAPSTADTQPPFRTVAFIVLLNVAKPFQQGLIVL